MINLLGAIHLPDLDDNKMVAIYGYVGLGGGARRIVREKEDLGRASFIARSIFNVNQRELPAEPNWHKQVPDPDLDDRAHYLGRREVRTFQDRMIARLPFEFDWKVTYI